MISNRRIDWEKKLTIRQRRWISYPLAGLAMSLLVHNFLQGYTLIEQISLPAGIKYLMWVLAFSGGIAMVNEYFNSKQSAP